MKTYRSGTIDVALLAEFFGNRSLDELLDINDLLTTEIRRKRRVIAQVRRTAK